MEQFKKVPRFNLGDKLKFGVSNYPKVKPTDGNQMDFRKRGIFMWVEKSTEIFVRESVCVCVCVCGRGEMLYKNISIIIPKIVVFIFKIKCGKLEFSFSK